MAMGFLQKIGLGARSAPLVMAAGDVAVIHAFAAGDTSLREAALGIHHAAIPTLGVRGTPEQRFMAEVDCPVPDLALREIYRAALVGRAQKVAEPEPEAEIAPAPGR